VEIEDDVVRLRRRKFEFERYADGRRDPWPLRVFNPFSTVSSVSAGRR
jgi:hypothetical protein